MEIDISGERRSVEFSGTAVELLKKLQVRREEVVIKINGRLAPETTELKGSERVEIIKVVFGG